MGRQPIVLRGTPPTGPSAPPTGPRRLHRILGRGDQRPPSYQFQGDSNNATRHRYGRRSPSPRSDIYRPSYSDSRKVESRRISSESDIRNRDEEFTFHFDSKSSENFRHAQNLPKENRSRPRKFERDRQNFNKPGRASKVAAEREFLRTNRAPTPQLMSGMNVESGKAAKFLPIEDLSDSEEADMDLSGNEDIGPQSKKLRTTSSVDDDNTPLWTQTVSSASTTQTDLPGAKETCARTTSKNKNNGKDNSSITATDKERENPPRWSNPDPYTALPPPDESQRKKKDFVRLIRKARITSDSGNKLEAPTDDFISFDLEEHDAASCSETSLKYASPNVRGQNIKEEKNLHKSERSRNPSKLHKAPRSPDSPRNSPPANKSGSRDLSRKNTNGKKTLTIDLTSDPDLGSRKRTYGDEIVDHPAAFQKGVRPPPDGRILRSWLPYDNISESPWLIEHPDTFEINDRFQEEILDFYDFVKPRVYEQTVREDLIDDLRWRVRNYDDEADIHSFGSFPAGLYLPTGDLDLVMTSEHFMQGGRPQFGRNPSQVRSFARFLEKERIVLHGSQECILKAKVPLVKYIDNLTGIKVDISFENTTGLVANNTFKTWKEKFPAMPILVTLIKQFLSMRGLNEPVNGGIGGFSVVCLVISLLQQMPQIQDGSMIPEHHLGEILMEFFDLYGNRFNTVTTAISINPARYIKKSELNLTYKSQVDKFSIIDPNDPTNDIAGGSKNSRTIRIAFQNAFYNLQRRMKDLQHSDMRSCPQSILSCIIGGNYSSFKVQRDHLARIYKKKYPDKTTDLGI